MTLLERYDVTDQFWKYILIPKEILKRKPKVRYATNNVQFRNIILFGFQGSGKTETARGIAYEVVRFYGKRNVNCAYSESGDIEAILKYGLENRLVNVLFLDNLTLRKISKESLRNYFRCRHLLEEKYGRRNGYILSLISLHRFWSIPTELRCNMNALLVKDSSLNPYDRQFLRKLYGDEILEFLDKLEILRVYHPELMEYSMFYSKFARGVVRIPMARKNYLREVDGAKIKIELPF